jgi:hypothetical protein
VVFVAAALMLKRASDLGADVWRTTRIINYMTALVAALLWLLGGTIPAAALWWQPPVAGCSSSAGRSSAVLIGDPIDARLWTAAALSSAAIALLNVSR